jgi:two-component system response regulator ResD
MTKNQRVLIVDDDRSVRQFMAAVIGQDGYSTVQAQNGMEAVELAENDRFDLLLTDLEMPGISGLELIRVVNERGLVRRSLIVTGRSSAEDMPGYAASVPLLAKPFTPGELLTTIEAVLNS